ncbi:MAG: hypothetical protein DWQ40_08170 [Actinobacteria bacterium]|nr:MAG: hypothetical protein DWQ40_08170 [Actinomycetota bacterium]
MGYQDHLHQLTGLGRPIDVREGSNLVAVLGSAVIGALIFIGTWIADGSPDLIVSVAGAIGGFLSWAIARELDPDRTQVANLALVAGGLFALAGPPALLVAGVALLAFRVIVNSVGTDLRPVDWVVLLAAAAYAGTTAIGWLISLALVFGVGRRPDRPRWLPPLMAAASIATAVLVAGVPEPGVPGTGVSVALLTTLIIGMWRSRAATVTSRSDSGTRSIQATDVSVARLAAVAILAFGAVLAPETAGIALGPIVASTLALAVPCRSKVAGAAPADSRSAEVAEAAAQR